MTIRPHRARSLRWTWGGLAGLVPESICRGDKPDAEVRWCTVKTLVGRGCAGQFSFWTINKHNMIAPVLAKMHA